MILDVALDLQGFPSTFPIFTLGRGGIVRNLLFY